MFGALSNLWVGDRLGRRKTIVLGGIIMIIGAVLQATSFSYAQMVVARIVTGLGNGLNVRPQLCEFCRTTFMIINLVDVDRARISCRVFVCSETWKFHHD